MDEPNLTPSATLTPARVYAAIVLALGVAAIASTGRIVAVAERLPFGGPRSALLAVLRPVDAAANAVGLGAPGHAVVAARGALGLDAGGAGGRQDGAAAAARARAVDGSETGGPGAADPSASDLSASDPSGADAVATPDEPMAATAAAMLREAWHGAGAPPGGLAAATGGIVAFGPTGTPLPPPTATPPPARPIGPDAPLRVVVAGDSFAQPLGFELQTFATRDQMTSVEIDGRISTGLARPDYFDWPARMTEIVATMDPEAVVFFVGANDDQNMVLDDETVVVMGSPEWTDEYAVRAALLMDECQGRRLYWVGMPVMREERHQRAAEAVNTAVRRAGATRPWVKFIDIWETFKGPDGRFSLYLPNETGEQIEMRGADGVHLSRTGTNKVAAMLYNAFGVAWDLATPTPTPTATGTATETATAEATDEATAEPHGNATEASTAEPVGGWPTVVPPPNVPHVPRIVTATPRG
ncbi:MAG: DUF459 domain-containing protein [Ardenticatenales bacterium]